MPRYTPQSLPTRSAGHPAQSGHPQPTQATCEIVAQAAGLGSSIRREQGMQGVRAYVKAMRPFLQPAELSELARIMGVPCPAAEPEPPHTQKPQTPSGDPPQSMPSGNNMAQLFQMFSQFSGMNQNGGPSQGMNPMMLAQLMNAFNQNR